MAKPTTKNVLIVEDDPTYLRLWEKLLEGHFKTDLVWTVSNPLEAVKILNLHKVDLLISDVVMQKMNGYDLAKLARKKNADAQIVLTTGYQADLSRYKLGQIRFHLLHKPYHNLSDVCAFVQHLLLGEDVYESMDEDSFSDNIDYPTITEWRL